MVVAFECDWTRGFEPAENQTEKIAFWRCTENATWIKPTLKCAQSGLLKELDYNGKTETVSNNAVATATTVLAVCGFFFAIVVCLDYMTLSRDIKRFRKNLGHLTKRFRDTGRAKQLHDVRVKVRNRYYVEESLKEHEKVKEEMQLNAAGFANEDEFGQVIVRNSRPMSSDASRQRHEHVEGEMELPEGKVDLSEEDE